MINFFNVFSSYCTKLTGMERIKFWRPKNSQVNCAGVKAHFTYISMHTPQGTYLSIHTSHGTFYIHFNAHFARHISHTFQYTLPKAHLTHASKTHLYSPTHTSDWWQYIIPLLWPVCHAWFRHFDCRTRGHRSLAAWPPPTPRASRPPSPPPLYWAGKQVDNCWFSSPVMWDCFCRLYNWNGKMLFSTMICGLLNIEACNMRGLRVCLYNVYTGKTSKSKQKFDL